MANRVDAILNGAAIWCSYYRANPHRFAMDYLHLDLRLFQKILLVMMNISTTFIYIASRGQGKTFLCAVYICTRCILYPGTKVCIASGTRGQALGVLEKIIRELKVRSAELANEIDDRETKMNGANAVVVFKNGSYAKVVTASDSARGNRANILIVDEFRLVLKDTIDTILRKFLSSVREPDYSELTKKEKEIEMLKEENQSIFLSSGYFQDHWSYQKCVDTCKMMLGNEHRWHFVCGLPYQLAILENLLRVTEVQDQMAESDFTEVKWSINISVLLKRIEPRWLAWSAAYAAPTVKL